MLHLRDVSYTCDNRSSVLIRNFGKLCPRVISPSRASHWWIAAPKKMNSPALVFCQLPLRLKDADAGSGKSSRCGKIVRPKEMWRRDQQCPLQEDVRIGLFVSWCGPKIQTVCTFKVRCQTSKWALLSFRSFRASFMTVELLTLFEDSWKVQRSGLKIFWGKFFWRNLSCEPLCLQMCLHLLSYQGVTVARYQKGTAGVKSLRLEMLEELQVDLGAWSKRSRRMVTDAFRGPRARSPGTCKSWGGVCFGFCSMYKGKSFEFFLEGQWHDSICLFERITLAAMKNLDLKEAKVEAGRPDGRTVQ